MALGSGISVSIGGGGSSGDTVHVNNQPMIVLLVHLEKGGCIRGLVGLGERGTHQSFPSYLFLSFSILTLPSSNLSAAKSTRHLSHLSCHEHTQ